MPTVAIFYRRSHLVKRRAENGKTEFIVCDGDNNDAPLGDPAANESGAWRHACRRLQEFSA